MANLPFSLLYHNSTELLAALQDKKSESLEKSLVSDFSGKYLYAQKSFRGRIYCWVFSFIKGLTKKNYKQKKYFQALEKTRQVFDTCQENITKEIQSYKEFVGKAMNGEKITNTQVKKGAQKIVKFYHYVYPLWIEHQNTSQTEKKAELPFFSLEEGQEEQKKKLSMVKSAYFTARFISELGSFSPLKTLAKQEGEEWTYKEKKLLEKITKKRKEKINWPFVAFNGFLSLARLLEVKDPIEQVGKWEKLLGKQNPAFFQIRDFQHERYIEGIKNSFQLQNMYELGNLVLEKEFMNLYANKDQKTTSLLYPNLFQVPLEGENLKKPGFGIPHAKLLRIDSEGSFIRLEWVQDPITDFLWENENLEKEKSKDYKLALALCNIVSFYQAKQETPENLKKEYLWKKETGELVSVHSLEKSGKYDYFLLEEFFKDIAKDNFSLFRFLMHVSGLNEDPIAKFFQDLVSKYSSSQSFETFFSAFSPPSDVDAKKLKEYAYLLFQKMEERVKNNPRRSLSGKSNSTEYLDVVDIAKEKEQKRMDQIIEEYKALGGGFHFLFWDRDEKIPEIDWSIHKKKLLKLEQGVKK